jgi:thiol-disulfide isomerase/thioredoxin
MAILISGILGAHPVQSAEPPLPYSKELGSLKLTVPTDKLIRKQLGIKAKSGQFGIADLRPGIIIIEIFNMYCPHCQKYAPTVNELHRLIQSNPKLKVKVLLLGIGVGNSPFEVNIFRKKYAVAFPLFDDKNYAISNLMHGLLTPHFIGLKVDGKGGYCVFYSKDGGFSNPKAFLDEMLKLSETACGGK